MSLSRWKLAGAKKDRDLALGMFRKVIIRLEKANQRLAEIKANSIERQMHYKEIERDASKQISDNNKSIKKMEDILE